MLPSHMQHPFVDRYRDSHNASPRSLTDEDTMNPPSSGKHPQLLLISCIMLPQHGSYPGTCLQIFWSDADLNENTFLSSNSTSLIKTDMECYHKWNRSSLTLSSERFHHRNGVNYGEADVNCNLALFISSLEITIHQQNTCQDYHFDQEVAENDDGWVSKICWFLLNIAVLVVAISQPLLVCQCGQWIFSVKTPSLLVECGWPWLLLVSIKSYLISHWEILSSGLLQLQHQCSLLNM